MSRTSQNGSVISFVVVGVLLTTAVLGGLYLVSERNFFGLGAESSEVAQAGEEAGEDVAGTTEEAGEDVAGTDEEAAADDVVVDTDEPAQAGDEGTSGDVGGEGASETPTDDTTLDNTETSDETAGSTDNTVNDQTGSGTDAVATEDSSDETEEMATTGFTGDGDRTGGAAELPTTGPSDTVLAMLGISSLVAAVLMYRRSTQL